MQPEERLAMTRFVVEQARRFELPALLDVLSLLGYTDADIELRSNPSVSHASSLVHEVKLTESPPQAIVVVNLGLMSGQGPLPSYFLELLATQRDTSLTEFLWFFEQPLLMQRLAGLVPERDTALFPNWLELRRTFRSLPRLTSPCQLHWLFQHVFPELEVAVRRTARQVSMPSPQAYLGKSGVGDGSTLGDHTLVPRHELEVLLYADSWTAVGAVPWPVAAQARLRQQVVPVLRALEPLLYVQMIFRDRSSTAALSPERLLGCEPLGIDPAELASQPSQRVELFRGVLTGDTGTGPALSV